MGMKCSDLLLALVLAVLAYLVYLLLNNCSNNRNTEEDTEEETFVNATSCAQVNKPVSQPETPILSQIKSLTSSLTAPMRQTVSIPMSKPVTETMTNIAPVQKINYEQFVNVEGVSDAVHGAAPFKGNAPVAEGDYATVSYTGLAEANPGEVLQIEGTDLLTAPLVDNMLYTNSIANTNRNASQDVRGDIPLQYNENYTPFYASTIYGAPLSQHAMTIGNVQ